MPAVLIIGGRLEALRKASALGLRTVFFQHKDRLLPGQAEAADAMFLADYTDWSVARPLARAAHESYGFTRVVSLVEQGMEMVGRINDLLGLEGTSYEVAHRFRDKLAMRGQLAAAGVPTAAAAPVSGPQELRAFGSEHGYPLVLKPVDGTGSRGVERIDGPAEAEAAWERAHALRGRTDLVLAQFYPVDRFMVEQYVDGSEYSVEAVSVQGRHAVVALTEKITENAVEWGHAQPARLTAENEAAILSCTAEFLDAMGLRDGLSHTEVRMSPAGPQIIESHDRVGGGRIMDLTHHAYGVDLEQYAVGAPFGLLPELPLRPAARAAAATRFLTAEPGEVVAVDGLDEVLAHPGLISADPGVTPGSVIPPVRDNFDRLGQVLCGAPDTTSAVDLCEVLADKISIRTRTTCP
jgi:biotin carboxylase